MLGCKGLRSWVHDFVFATKGVSQSVTWSVLAGSVLVWEAKGQMGICNKRLLTTRTAKLVM